MTIPLWCLFAAAVLTLLSKAPLRKAQTELGAYDNHYPREQQKLLQGWGRRALAAHQNQLESFPYFCAGVIVTTVMDVDTAAVNYLTITHLIGRVAFMVCYLADKATLRTISFEVGTLSSLALLCSPAWA